MPDQATRSLSPGWGSPGGWAIYAGALTVAAFAALGLGAMLRQKLSAPAPAVSDKVEAPVIVAKAAGLLEIELSRVLGLIRARIGSDEAYARSLAGAQARLSALPASEQVRVIVSLLIDENQRMRLDLAKMSKDIQASAEHIQALRSSLESAQQVGLRDALTGVGNRRCFDLTLETAVEEADRSGAALSVIMGDIDSFKGINDAFGHQVGDEVLKVFSRLLASSVRERDTVTRYGGEEFAVILSGVSVEEAGAIAERIRGEFETKHLSVRKTAQELGQVTASFGVTQYVQGESMDAVVRRADRLLYEAKNAGRNFVVSDLGRIPRAA